ncbi:MULTISPECIES: TetR/AcrR family transcriptional regulator [unclassified Crossiella]|uniref:TetR/AcrR family transcriptional regulator n=1 Tax=unclassified Crossiella TaxID=2620835 RepID=UPI001FFFFA2F|nr:MULTISPECIES: TetR/AcrR family transcriptional regulator [unclassified Crossiella]MCK2244032.1 TetR/AcrR family transcriptional regulator [Crossiella sp. S99.2]MCK2257110.1 TetR/AcrR family transcriptional regulator [Crossiella sp. S99.1]
MTSSTRESGSRSRTRKAILDAAVTVLAQRSTASMAEIADAAEVGRSTLHRYFPERSELMTAIFRMTVERLGTALAEAKLAEGTAAEALRRAVHAYFELTPALIQVCSEGQQRNEDGWLNAAFDLADRPVVALIARAQAEGYLDQSISPEWIYKVLWWNVFAGIEATGEGLMGKHQAAESVIRLLERGLLASAGS